jgi:multiple sugar transport system permease protein
MIRVVPDRVASAIRRPTSRRLRATGATRRVGGYLVLAIAAFAAIAPFLWAVSTSLKPEGRAFADVSLIPRELTPGNYGEVLEDIPFIRYLVNTTIYASVICIGQIISCSLAGYVFARMAFRGRDVAFLLYLGTIMVPPTVTLVPQFMIMKEFGWIGSPLSMTVPFLFGSAFGTFLMRQFFLTLPVELEEAALIDGANRIQIIVRVLLPLMRPAVAVLGVLTWVTIWNDFLWPLLMVRGDEYATLTLGLLQLQGQNYTNWPVLMAGAVMTAAPLLFVYAFAQRSFIQGFTHSGLGGN